MTSTNSFTNVSVFYLSNIYKCSHKKTEEKSISRTSCWI